MSEDLFSGLSHFEVAVIVLNSRFETVYFNRQAAELIRQSDEPDEKTIVETLASAVSKNVDESGAAVNSQFTIADTAVTVQTVTTGDTLFYQCFIRGVQSEMPPISRFIEHLGDGFFSLNKDLIITYQNQKAREMIGTPDEDHTGQYIFEAFPHAKGSIFEKKYREVLETQKAVSFDVHYDSPPFNDWYEVRVHPFEGGLMVFFQVITAHKAFEHKHVSLQRQMLDVINNAGEGFFLTDEGFRIIYFNSTALNITGRAGRQLEGMHLFDAFPEAEGSVLEEKYRKILDTGRKDEFETFFEPHDSWYRVRAYRVEQGLAVFFTDVSAEVAKKRLLKLQADILATVEQAVITTDLNGQIIFWNRFAEKLYGYSATEVTGHNISRVTPSTESRDQSEEIMRLLKKSGHWAGEFRVSDKSGREFPAFVSNYLLNDDRGRPAYIVGFSHDITARRLTQDRLKRSESLLEQAEKVAHIGSWRYIETAKEIIWSHGLYRIFNRHPGKGPPTLLEYRSYIDHNYWTFFVTEWKKSTEERKPYSVEMPLNLKSGTRWIISVGEPEFDSEGRYTGYIGFTQDITTSKELQNRMGQTLAEKEILLKELYHRTKNNMQVIQGMLRMQSIASSNTEFIQYAAEIESKIQSMALVHQMLYRSNDLSSIDLGRYLEQLTDFLVENYNYSEHPVSLQFNLSHIPVPIDIAIPVGLVISELVTNTFKHAFINSEENNIISVELDSSDHTIIINYRDNGCGLPEGFDIENSPTLGLSAVNALIVHQLGGEVYLKNNDGFSCHFKLPVNRVKKRV